MHAYEPLRGVMSSDQASTAATFDCPSCGVQSAGGFCRNCGEKKAGPRDFTLRHYFDVAINFLTHFDTKGYRTLWLVVSKPGYLSTEYLRGSRVRYLKPFPLFVALSVVMLGGGVVSAALQELRLRRQSPA